MSKNTRKSAKRDKKIRNDKISCKLLAFQSNHNLAAKHKSKNIVVDYSQSGKEGPNLFQRWATNIVLRLGNLNVRV